MTPASTSPAVLASSLPASLADLREISARGAILAGFERSVYLDLDGRIVALASADLARGPLAVTVSDFATVRTVPITGVVTLAGGMLRVGPVAVDLRVAPVWDPALPPAAVKVGSGSTVTRDAAIVELLTGGPEQGIAELLATRHESSVAPQGELLAALGRGLGAIADLLSGHPHPRAVAGIAAQEIAGRGPGLTPSGDDLLIGILYALSVWPVLAAAGTAAAVRDLLVEAARPRTTRLSRAYLEAARRGWAAEPWHALIQSLDGPPARTRAAVRSLLRIGETSGADALTGFCWAWRRVASGVAAQARGGPS